MLHRKKKQQDKPKEWVSAKIPKEVHEKLKDGGKGIGEALTLMVSSQEEAFEKKLESIEQLGTELADTLLQYGIPDIRFAGSTIEDILEEGTYLIIKGNIRISIEPEEARKAVIDILKPKPAPKEVKEDEHVEASN